MLVRSHVFHFINKSYFPKVALKDFEVLGLFIFPRAQQTFPFGQSVWGRLVVGEKGVVLAGLGWLKILHISNVILRQSANDNA